MNEPEAFSFAAPLQASPNDSKRRPRAQIGDSRAQDRMHRMMPAQLRPRPMRDLRATRPPRTFPSAAMCPNKIQLLHLEMRIYNFKIDCQPSFAEGPIRVDG